MYKFTILLLGFQSNDSFYFMSVIVVFHEIFSYSPHVFIHVLARNAITLSTIEANFFVLLWTTINTYFNLIISMERTKKEILNECECTGLQIGRFYSMNFHTSIQNSELKTVHEMTFGLLRTPRAQKRFQNVYEILHSIFSMHSCLRYSHKISEGRILMCAHSIYANRISFSIVFITFSFASTSTTALSPYVYRLCVL